MSEIFRRAKSNALSRELRRTLGKRYTGNAAEQTATVLGSGQLKIGGQRYPATGVSAAAGQTVTVRNIGRAGNATYAPAVGNITVSSGGRASGAGSSGATTFDELTDTPSSKSGSNDLFARVDGTATGITYGAIVAADIPVSNLIDTSYGLTVSSNKARVSLAGTSALEFTSGALRVKSAIAGAGLTMASQVLAVGGGDGITVSADAVAVNASAIVDASYGLAVTSNDIRINLASPAGLEFSGGALQMQDAIAGAGLTVSAKVLAVGAGDGIDVAANSIAVDVSDLVGAGLKDDGSNNLALQTPGTLTVSTDNDATGSHTHAITSSSDPRAAASLLATDSAGQLTVETMRVRDHIEAADTGRPAVKIRRLSGQTSYLWRVEDEDQNGLIGATSEGDLESLNPGFTSGIAGWQISAEGDAEFNNIRARGELHATTFVADEMHALGGTFVALTATTTSAPAQTGGNPGDTIAAYTWHPVSGPITYPSAVAIDGFTLPVSASYATGLCYFADGDILRIKDLGQPASGGNLDLYDLYLEVDGSPTYNNDRDMSQGQPGTFDVPVVLRYPTSGANGINIPAGASVIKWGENTGSGYTGGLLFTSDLNDAPYMDIFTVDSSGAAWPPAVVPRVRVGNLDGVLGLAEQWGIAAGADLTDTSPNAAYMVLSDTQQTTNNITSRWKSSGVTWAEFDPSGKRAKFGTNTASSTTTLFDLNVSANTLTIGNATSPTAVTVTGTINIQNPGDIDTSQITDGANLGGTAAWGGVSNIPARFGNAPSGTGLFLTATHMGYYNGSAWKTYADNSGNFYLAGAGSHSLSWNGSSLTIAGSITVLGGNAATTSAVTAAADAAQAYGDARRVLALSGTWTASSATQIAWTSAQVRFGDGSTKSLANGNTGTMSALSYLYVDAEASAPLTVGITTSLSTLTASHAVIAVAQPGAIWATVRSAAGVTMISGDQILTGSIVANNIAAGTITGTQISSATSITAGSGNDVAILSGSDATYRIWAGHASPGSAPFAVTKTGAIRASSANITGHIVATSGTFSNITVAGEIAVGTSGSIYSGISSWGSGTGYWMDYNSGTPRFVVGVQSGGLLSRGLQWDGSDLKIKMRDGAVNLLTVGDSAQAGFIDIDTRQSSGAGAFDYGIHISDGGNTSAGVSALYHGESNQGAGAIDRIFDAYTSNASNVADGYYAEIAGGNWNSGTPWNSNGVGVKAQSATAPTIAAKRTGSGYAPTIWATNAATGGAMYSASVGATSQTAFHVDNSLGSTNLVALNAGLGNITEVKYLIMKGAVADPNPATLPIPSGYFAVYMGGDGALRKMDSGGNISNA